MIVKMKKLSVLLYHREKGAFLDAVQALGVVHVVENPELSSEQLQSLVHSVKSHEAVRDGLKAAVAGIKGGVAQRTDKTGAEVLAAYQDLTSRREKVDQAVGALEKDVALLAPWGEFDPARVAGLSDVGVKVRFFEATAKQFAVILQSGLTVERIADARSRVLFVLIESDARAEIDADEIQMPRTSLRQAQTQLAAKTQERASVEASLRELAAYAGVVEAEKESYRSRQGLESARINMQDHADGAVVQLSGWLPAAREKKVREQLDRFSAWYAIEKPVAGDDVPVAISNDAFSRLFEPVLKMYALPGYGEIDPTPFFAPFLMMFVGLCIGDVAYGSIIFLGSLIAFFKIPKTYRVFALLGVVLGASTIVAGLLLNGFFGITIFGGPGAPTPAIFPFGAKYALFTPMSTPTGIVYPMMTFSLLVGFLQIMLAFVVRIVNKLRTSGWKAAMVPVSFILFTVGGLSSAAHINLLSLGIGSFTVCGICFGAVLMAIPKNVALVLFFASFPLNIFFSNMDKKGGERAIMIAVDLYNGMISGIFGNILSYMRLFALGLTGGLLGGVFNQLAMMFITGKDGAVHWLSPFAVFSVLLLVAGHTLNFALSIVGAGVHPLRLTYVEFLQNLDYSWGGKPYKPLAKSS